MPPHSGQAPYGLLNENIRGETSGKEMPQSAQASLSEKTMGSARSAVGRLCDPGFCFTGGRVPLPPAPPARVMSRPAVLLVMWRLAVLLVMSRLAVLLVMSRFAVVLSRPAAPLSRL